MKSDDKRFHSVDQLLAEQEAIFQQKVDTFYTEIEELWNLHINENTLSETAINRFSTICKADLQQVIQEVDTLMRYLGMEAIMETSSLNKIWRDLHTASQHAFITPL